MKLSCLLVSLLGYAAIQFCTGQGTGGPGTGNQGRCTRDGRTIENGEQIRVDCNTCTCRNGQLDCTTLDCPTTGAPRPRPDSRNRDRCTRDGRTIENGEQIRVDCNTCTCRNGQLDCTTLECPTTGAPRPRPDSRNRDRCTRDGKTIENGEQIRVDCNTCTCRNGRLDCTTLECPTTRAPRTRPDSGSQGRCTRDGKTIGNGEQIRIDCNTCTCRNGRLDCTTLECPTTRAPRTRPDSGNRGRCTRDGKTIENGEQIRVDCNTCTCRNGRLDCTTLECPTTRAPRTTSSRGSAVNRGRCTHGGKTIANGEQVREDCNTCTCRNGRMDCTKLQCPTTRAPRGGTGSPSEKPGKCPRPIRSGSCERKCNADKDCRGTRKCCNNGCGTDCLRPVITRP